MITWPRLSENTEPLADSGRMTSYDLWSRERLAALLCSPSTGLKCKLQKSLLTERRRKNTKKISWLITNYQYFKMSLEKYMLLPFFLAFCQCCQNVRPPSTLYKPMSAFARPPLLHLSANIRNWQLPTPFDRWHHLWMAPSIGQPWLSCHCLTQVLWIRLKNL